MAEITAQAVKALRDETSLPMMECKSALSEAEGDHDLAVEILRKRGLSTAAKRSGRETSEGLIAAHVTATSASMVELRCESAPVAKNEIFSGLAETLAETLSGDSSITDPETLLQKSDPRNTSQTLEDAFADAKNQLRENMTLSRIGRWEGVSAGYVHHDGRQAAVIQVDQTASDDQILRQICMHIVSLRPVAASQAEIDPALIAKEREILSEQARATGKPEQVIEKIVEGRMRNFFAERVLPEQAFALDSSKTVGEVLNDVGVKLERFVRWELGESTAT